MTEPDQAITALLDLDPSKTSVSKHGGSNFAGISKLTTTLPDGNLKHYFLKTGPGASSATMFAGEHASLSAIHSAVPTLCPASHGHGTLSSRPNHSFLVTDWLDLRGRPRDRSTASLAQKLARLHTAPAPTPAGYARPQFGFPVTTCCGDTPQDNKFSASWSEFFAERRLRAVARRAQERHGKDAALQDLVDRTCDGVVPRLLREGHLGGKEGVVPVMVHGDLWSGNAGVGRMAGGEAEEAVVFDPSACYAHSEFELGIMKLFGGFDGEFMKEYHKLVPKTEPVEEYEDRVRLYALYHQLNHYSLFGGGYKNGALSMMRELTKKYDKNEQKKGEL